MFVTYAKSKSHLWLSSNVFYAVLRKSVVLVINVTKLVKYVGTSISMLTKHNEVEDNKKMIMRLIMKSLDFLD